MLPSEDDKAKLFTGNVSGSTNLDDSGIPLTAFLTRTNMKLQNISLTPEPVYMVITNLDLLNAYGPDCITVVDLKKCEPELSYTLAELFNMCLKESCFTDCWKILSVVPVFRNVEDGSTAKSYCPFSLLSVVSKIFENFTNGLLHKFKSYGILCQVIGLTLSFLSNRWLQGFWMGSFNKNIIFMLVFFKATCSFTFPTLHV